METKNNSVLDNLKDLIQNSKQIGHETIPLYVLEQYLSDEFKSAVEKRNVYLHEMEVWKINAPLESAKSLEMFKAVLETGQTAIKSATLINGGAAVALLAFLGSSSTSKDAGLINNLHILNYALIAFVVGVAFAGITSGLRYISQAIYSEVMETGKWRAWGNCIRNAAIFFGCLSFITFLAGSGIAARAFCSL